MNEQFIYSVLQYKHSLALGESLNIGVLFSFPNENKIYFVAGNTQRLKCVYPNFDSVIFTKISRSIKLKVDNYNSANNPLYNIENLSFKDYINSKILPEDSSSLQFTDPFVVTNDFKNSKKAIDEFSKILLLNTEEKSDEHKHNEQYIIKNYSDRLVRKVNNIKLDTRLRRDYQINTKKASLSFDIAWKNETLLHLVKPISFDLTDEHHIQDKAVRFWGYFGLLNEYAKKNDLYFDLLIAAPQNQDLNNAYLNALDTLKGTNAPKGIYTEDEWEEYSDETASNLNKELL